MIMRCIFIFIFGVMQFGPALLVIVAFCSFVLGINALWAKDIQKRSRAKYYFVVSGISIALCVALIVIIKLLIKAGFYL